ncbi:MAG: response regulator [Desulfovibrionaceae bacterium]|nr:response regulator [Desulfovibrionaceae bacterium]MBF0512891.1 response regulator [Desulfovibrionaceae bacterium]
MPGEPFRLLIADDESAILELFSEILASEPQGRSPKLSELSSSLFGSPSDQGAPGRFELTLAARGETAVAEVKRALDENRPFAVAFLDVRMPPGMGGVEAAERIRTMDPMVQIVCITAYSDVDPREISARIPPPDKLLYLQKPFDPQEIIQLAWSLAAKWKAERDYIALRQRLESLVEERTSELARANAQLTREIKARAKVAKLVASAKAEWESTFDSVQDLILILSRDNRVKRLNMAMANRLGLSPRLVAGKPLGEVLKPDLHPGPYYRDLLEMCDGAFHTKELSIPGLRGEFLVTASPMHDAAGALEQTVLVAHDVTQRKGLEARLRQSQKMEAIGTLAGGIAHDFNNILGIIMGFAEMAMDASKDDATMSRRVNHILDACQRARDLIFQILTFSRQSSEEVSPLRVGPLIAETMKLLAATLPKNIAIEERIDPGDDWVRADPTQIQQILMNLCANAAHAMREKGGSLFVGLETLELGAAEAQALPGLSPGRHARLTVRDTGHGMKPEILDRIFDPFFTTKNPGVGTGMGLSVVHGIVQKYGGAVNVASRPDAGSTFEIYLPLETPGKAAGTLPARPDSPPSGQGRVLAVDDEKTLLEMTRDMLTSLGYTVTAVSSPAEALKLFAANPAAFDAVLTDQTMPGMSGAELAREMLALRPEIPIVMSTGYSETINPEKAAGLGIREYLLKPVLKRALAEAMARALTS